MEGWLWEIMYPPVEEKVPICGYPIYTTTTLIFVPKTLSCKKNE